MRPLRSRSRRVWLALLCIAGLLARLGGPALPQSPLAMLLDPSAICHAPGDDSGGDVPGQIADHDCCTLHHGFVFAALTPVLTVLPAPAWSGVAVPVADVSTGAPRAPPGIPQARAPPVLSA